jgi:transcription-repair coupling factor (superfamily II helicase)
LANLEKTEQLEEMEQELHDRFGVLPAEVKNLLYAVRVKILVTPTGIESVTTTERNEIVLSLFEGMRFDLVKLGHLTRDGITITPANIKLSLRRLGKGWQKTLESVVSNIA